jgi:hypothetical protein
MISYTCWNGMLQLVQNKYKHGQVKHNWVIDMSDEPMTNIIDLGSLEIKIMMS